MIHGFFLVQDRHDIRRGRVSQILRDMSVVASVHIDVAAHIGILDLKVRLLSHLPRPLTGSRSMLLESRTGEPGRDVLD